MEKSIVEIKDNDLFVGTWDLSQGFGIEHRVFKKLINKYRKEFESWGLIASPVQRVDPKKGGGQIEEFLLNERQATYLCTLLTNNDRIRIFKIKLTNQFYDQRSLLMRIANQKSNEEWLQKRKSGKVQRKTETDAIKEFVEYSKSQGSKNADKYYMVISKMENQSLLNLDFLTQKFDNLRDVIDVFSLSALQIADVMVATALKEGMKKSMNYKDIYVLARDRVETMAISMGKTPIRLAINQDKALLPT